MKKSIIICILAVMVLTAAGQLRADWQRSPASDVDKEFLSGNPGVTFGAPEHEDDNSCWLAAAANMLAGAGYGNGATLQARAEDIYLDLLYWQVSIDPTNIHGVRDGGWTDTALDWWLRSPHNLWDGAHVGYAANPYTVITPRGSKTFEPWADPDGARFIGNEIREYRTVSIGIRWPRLFPFGEPYDGHNLTCWGDSGTSDILTTNPAELIVADADNDYGGDFTAYTYDDYTNPNPSGLIDNKCNEGHGWYINYTNNHPYIVWLVTLGPTDSPVDPHDGPTQKVVGSTKRLQPRPQSATDLHYEAYTDYDILAYRTEIDWNTSNAPVILESNDHHSWLTRDTIHVDWDLSDNPVPYYTPVTITTEFILQGYNGIGYDDVYFTYGTGAAAGLPLPSFGWNIVTPQLADANIVDITGGFVIGAFDLYDFAGEPNLVCQYRLIHQYPYTQDPERHTFTLWGTNGRCADFDDLAVGTMYNVGDVFVTQGYSVECSEFFWLPSGSTTDGFASVNGASASGGTGLELQLNNINAEFDFGSRVPCVSFLFGEYGGNVNLEVNRDFRNFENFADINGLIIGGCSVTVTGGHGNDMGTVLIQGQVDQFKLGGQELFIDEVCPFCEDTDRYMATNFRFGHSYGMLDTESLWQFNDWMIVSPERATLSQGEPFKLTLNWDHLLPYPLSNIIPADQIQDAPECTVYLEADLNKDCYVDFKDLAILSDQWLQSTAFGDRTE